MKYIIFCGYFIK